MSGGGPGLASPAAGTERRFVLLTGDFRIFQRQDGHRWSLDDLLTAWLAARLVPQPPNRFLDLGCGIGSVLMMLAWRFPEARGVGIEAQSLSVDLARRSLQYNGLEDRIVAHHADFRQPLGPAGAERFALVTGTPPYFQTDAGTESGKPQCGPCRFEWRGGVEAYLEAAARHLESPGLFVMVAAAAQTPRVNAAARGLGLGKIHQLDVVPKLHKPPLIALHGFAWQAPVRESPAETLVVRDEHDQWSPAFRAVREAMGMPVQPPRSAVNESAAAPPAENTLREPPGGKVLSS